MPNQKFAGLWEEVWGGPIACDDANIDENYDRIGLVIAAYEGSNEVNQFSSKYDYYLRGEVELTDQEAWGLELFNDEEKGKCALCHISEVDSPIEPPFFTDFTFDNLGIPKNPLNPFYGMDLVYLDGGSPINPLGADWIDYGLGGFLSTHSNPAWAALAADNMGKHKVPTLRNVDKRQDVDFPKAYGHNGYFKNLKGIVNFYNTRDTKPSCPWSMTEKEALMIGCWPAPEVGANVNVDELGNLGLTDEEEDAIVAFMQTLSDGYLP